MSNHSKNNLKSFLKNIVKYQKYIVIGVFAVFFGFISYEYYNYFNLLKNPQGIKNIILQNKSYSFLIFIAIQITQVIVFFIPGEIIQIAGGYIFGTFLGGILSLLGITIGSAIAYHFSRYLGREFINNTFSNDKFKILNKIIPNKNNKYLIFILYLIPGIPKDALAYICGVSRVSFSDFIILSTLGRIPCIFFSTYFGYKIEVGEISTLIVVTIVMTVLFLIGFLKREKIVKRFSRRKS